MENEPRTRNGRGNLSSVTLLGSKTDARRSLAKASIENGEDVVQEGGT